MKTEGQCPSCGSRIPANSTGGVCPRCLLGLAVNRFAEPVPEGKVHVGDYELLEEIGRGGMGVIYRARQHRLDRTVALKMVDQHGLKSPSARMRFEIEASAIASLNHPHIVSLYETGECGGQLFYSMQYVSGGTFGDIVRDSSVPLKRKVRLLSKIAGAVQFAHSNGVLHRDLKPSNILVGDDGEPLLADFGLAKRDSAEADLTHTEAILGSPNYMAPEQIAHTSAVTIAADVYSLGAILYETLTARPPFDGKTPLETMRLVQDSEPELPGLPANVPRDLQVVCLKCLEKNPTQRYRSAAALSDELERWLNGQAVEARPVGRAERLVRWCRREPALAVSLGLIALLLVGVAVVSFSAYVRIRAASQQMAAANRQMVAANRRTEEQLYRSQLRYVDDLLGKGNSIDARALLASLARRRPDDRVVMTRLANGLRYDVVPRMVAPSIHVGNAEVLALEVSGPGEAMVVTRSGRVLKLSQTEGRVSEIVVDLGETVTSAVVAKRSFDVACLLTSGRVAIVGTLDRTVEYLGERGLNANLVAISENGGHVAVVEEWRHLMMWNRHQRRQILGPIEFPDGVSAIEFDPSGRMLAVGLSRGGGRLWDVRSGELVQSFLVCSGSFHDVDMSQDGQTIAFASPGGGISFWDLAEGRSLASQSLEHRSRVNGIRFNAAGDKAVSFDAQGRAKIWDLENLGTPVEVRHIDYIADATFGPEGRVLVTAAHDRMVRSWDVVTGAPLSEPMIHTSGVQGIRLGETAGDVRAYGYDGTVWQWRVEGALIEPRVIAGGKLTGSVALALEDGRVALGVRSMQRGWALSIIDPLAGLVVESVATPDSPGLLRFNHDRSLLAVRMGHEVQIRRTRDLGLVCDPLHFRFGGIIDLAFSSKENVLAVASQWEPVKLLSLTDDGESVMELPVSDVERVTFNPDGQFLVTSDVRGDCRMWDSRTGTSRGTLAGNGHAVSFSEGGRFAAMVGGQRAYLVDVTLNQWLTGMVMHDSQITTAAIGPDSQWLATASMDQTVQLAQVVGQQLVPVHQLLHAESVTALAFSRDGGVLATGAANGDLRLWDVVSGTPVTEWLPHNAPIQGIGFDVPGQHVITILQTGEVVTRPFVALPSGAGAWLPDLAEFLVQHRFDGQGQSRLLSLNELNARSAQLRTALERNPESALLKRFVIPESVPR